MAMYIKGADGEAVKVKVYDIPDYKEFQTTEAYTSRVTANGERVADGSKAELLSVEGATVKSKNLFDISKLSTWGNVINNGDGTITVKSYGAGTKETLRILCPSLRAGDTATLSFITTDTDRYFIYINTGGTYQEWSNGKSKVVTEELLDSNIWFYTNSSSDTEAIISNIQIELGTVTTEYQPYFTGLKSASFKGIKSTGRNLLDYKNPTLVNPNITYDIDESTNTIIFNSNFRTNPRAYYYVKVKVGKTYTVSIKTLESNSTMYGLFVGNTINPDKMEYVRIGKGENVSATFTATSEDLYLKFYINYEKSTDENNDYYVKFEKFMLNEGETAFPFEPYTEDTLEFPEAIDCGLGTTIDFENQKIVEKGVTIVLTGEEHWIISNSGYTVNDRYYSSLRINNVLTSSENRARGIVTDGELIGARYDDGGWWVGVTSKELFLLGAERYFGFTQFADPNNPTAEERATLLAEWKAYLAQRYADGNPVTIRYVSSTVQAETPFTTEQKAVGDRYAVLNKGTETTEQGETDNSVHGAMLTVTQGYIDGTLVKGEIRDGGKSK